MNFVYFITIGKFIKIGFTTNLSKRLKNFRGASAEPIRVLLTIQGERILERRLHDLFSADRVTNEFFRDTWHVREFIRVAKDDLATAFEHIEWWNRCRNRTPAEQKLFADQQKRISENRYQKIVAERIRLRDQDRRTRRPDCQTLSRKTAKPIYAEW